MFNFTGAPVPVRQDLSDAYGEVWLHFGSPGATLTADQRISLAEYVRSVADGNSPESIEQPRQLLDLAATLFTEPGLVNAAMVTSATEAVGDPVVVEVISLVSMLSAIDGAHRALGAELEALPPPRSGEPTGDIAPGLKRRRTHVPMPAGAIPMALDLLPGIGQVFKGSFGPQYMTDTEMASDRFERKPGLNRAQIEMVSSRTSLINRCFY